MTTQKVARILTSTLSGLLAVGLAAATAAPAFGQAHGTFTFTGSMNIARAFHTATLLQNGQVLVAGGLCTHSAQCAGAGTDPTATAELYNPATGQWTFTGSMSTPRQGHTATLLANGDVLVTGGFTDSELIVDRAELYNPSTGTWSTTGSMTVGRFLHSAVLLQNGEVLVAAGFVPVGACCPNCYCTDPTTTAELYHPSTGTFTATASMNVERGESQLTLLQNGEALIAGGVDAGGKCSPTAELFSNGHWSLTANLVSCAEITTAALLPNGDVVMDGSSPIQFYDPSTNVWQGTLGSADIHLGPLALLATGNVLVAGTEGCCGSSNAALYDPSTNEWTQTGSLNQARGALTLTRLLNGQVLAAGGEFETRTHTGCGGTRTIISSIASAELYTP
jgi:hypothetical protein